MSEHYITRPDLFTPTIIHPFKPLLGAKYEKLASGVEANAHQPNIAVIARTKNDLKGLQKIVENIVWQREHYAGRIDLIVVDTESTDGTVEFATESLATIVTMKQSEFNYPKGLNIGLEAVEDDVEAAFLTVGHAQMVLKNGLFAAASHFVDASVTGVYGETIPSEDVSIWDSLSTSYLGLLAHSSKQITEVKTGVMGANGAMVRMSTWKERPFSEDYAGGGEDTHWARLAFQNNEKIIFDPAVAVHHSHRLSFINHMRQVHHWFTVVDQPTAFDSEAVFKRRPDLDI